MQRIISANTTVSNITPVRYVLQYIAIDEISGLPVTVSIGTTVGGTDIVESLVIPANGQTVLSIMKTPNPKITLYFTSASWGGAKLKVTFKNEKSI